MPWSSAKKPTGSSPRLRGTQRRAPARRAGGRFIPAPAGNAAGDIASPTIPSVHPRACGERADIIASTGVEDGSSPRLRGTLFTKSPTSSSHRFIPAPAGNALAIERPPCRPPVHPRACGERIRAEIFVTCSAGSSPRLRGTPDRVKDGKNLHRFIPAPAGNACFCGCTTSVSSVHPRACGERTLGGSDDWPSGGSSPRLRGTPPAVDAREYQQRFIPAPAGNASRQPR